jgi:ABC-type transport system involved in multi-copper enzyme maturation permease subunit
MNQILLIARDSIRFLLHQRLLIGLMLVSLAMTIFFTIVMNTTRKNITAQFDIDAAGTNNIVIGKMNDEERKRMNEAMEQGTNAVQAFFYAATSFGGNFVALLIFSTAVTSEIRRGSIRLTLSKPVSRAQFLLGKYLGGIAVMAAYAIIASLAMLLFSTTSDVALGPAMKFAPWLLFCSQLMLGSLAMLLSLFMHPAIACVLAYVSGNGVYSTANPIYYLLPSYAPFNVFREIIDGSVMNASDVLYLTLYAVDFIVLMLLLAWWRFKSKEVC